MKKVKASTGDFDSILGMKAEAEEKKIISVKAEPQKVNSITENGVHTSLYYPQVWRKLLKLQALHEDVKVNDLIVEGIKLMFEKRGINPDKAS